MTKLKILKELYQLKFCLDRIPRKKTIQKSVISAFPGTNYNNFSTTQQNKDCQRLNNFLGMRNAMPLCRPFFSL